MIPLAKWADFCSSPRKSNKFDLSALHYVAWSIHFYSYGSTWQSIYPKYKNKNVNIKFFGMSFNRGGRRPSTRGIAGKEGNG